MPLTEVLELSAYIVIGSGVGTFVTQELFKHRLNKQLFRFSKLYSDKLEIIRILYKKLVLMEKALDTFMSQREPSDDFEKAKFKEETVKVINDFIEYYEFNEIIFDDYTVDIMGQILKKIKESKKSQNLANIFEDSRGTDVWLKAISDKQELYDEFVIDEFPKLKDKLKKDFQKRYKLLSK
ncbi:MAG: hypothetical protein M0Q90_12800 [Bacteroidales bacterium]|nr:hypothetical protein [Bacteroidales bacterium]